MNMNELKISEEISQKTAQESAVPHAYVEEPNLNPSSMDVLQQFQANMTTLEDLSARLRFMMTEIRGLIR